MESDESGLDELLRLSQQFTKKEEELTKKEQQRAEQKQKVQGVLQGLRGINFSVALQQHETVAAPDVVKAVNSLKDKKGTEDLRKLITDLVDDVERHVGRLSSEEVGERGDDLKV
ncbi:hypothetical protein ACFLWZ_07890 [Chloroflexota bacterium]